jgi:hypothetical protein
MLFEATKKKLQAFTRDSQLIIHNMYSFANMAHGRSSDDVTEKPGRPTNVPIYVSDEVVHEILSSAFTVSNKTVTAPGMFYFNVLRLTRARHAVDRAALVPSNPLRD